MTIRSPEQGPVRVAFGHPFGETVGGAERVLMDLLEHRVDAGIEPLLVCFEDGLFVEQARALGIETEVLSPGRFREPWRLAAAWVRLGRILRVWRPDVCVSWLPRVQTVLAPAAAIAGLRDRIVYVEQEITTGDLLHRVAVALPCAKVIAVSRGAAEANHRLWPHRDNVVVAPGIRAQQAVPQGELDTLRMRLGIPSDRPVIGTFGRLVRYKRADQAIRAVALLRDRHEDVTLLVVGGEAHGVDAGFLQELEELADHLGVGDRVIFTGHVEDAGAHMGLCDVTVSGAEREAFGLVFLESMSLGIPVVAVARGGPLDIFEDGVGGVLVPTGRAADLAAGLSQLLGDAPLRARIAQAGRLRVARTFTLEAMASGFGRELAATGARG